MDKDKDKEEKQFGFMFVEPQGSGSVTSDPEEIQHLKDLVEWQKQSAKARWIIGGPRLPDAEE